MRHLIGLALRFHILCNQKMYIVEIPFLILVSQKYTSDTFFVLASNFK